jgi:hypothetical protein
VSWSRRLSLHIVQALDIEAMAQLPGRRTSIASGNKQRTKESLA